MSIRLDAAMERKLSIDFRRTRTWIEFKSHRETDVITGNIDRVKFHVKTVYL